MARFERSDDSGDSDFDPRRSEGKGKKNSAKKKKKKKEKRAGASSLPTPGITPTDSTFASHFTAYRQDSAISTQHGMQPPVTAQPQLPGQSSLAVLAPTPHSPAFTHNGMLQFEDEILDGQLNFSRRGRRGHTSRDTADIWTYIFRLFFPMEEGYDIIIHNYQEQIGDDFLNEDELPGGVPVIIQLGKSVRQFHPLARRYVTTASTPMLAIVCGSVESSFAEFPGVRHKVDGTQDVFVDTPLQADLYSHLCGVMEQHNTSVQQLRNQAQAIKSVDGAVACGAMVRFFKAKAEHAGSGWLRAWSARGLDLVNGAPSNSMLTVERILSKIKDSGKKSKV